jgi:hypothetical protein
MLSRRLRRSSALLILWSGSPGPFPVSVAAPEQALSETSDEDSQILPRAGAEDSQILPRAGDGDSQILSRASDDDSQTLSQPSDDDSGGGASSTSPGRR